MMTAEQLKNSILQLAMQGKLVDQDLDEGSGIENLALIEKNFKVKKKISIDDDEFPFEIPAPWVWTKVGNITHLYNGRAFKPSDWTEEGLPIVRIQNLNDSNAPFNRYNGTFDDVYHLYGGELLFAWSGTPGTSFGAHIWRKEEAVLNQHIFKIEFPEEFLDKHYFALALNFQVLNLIRLAHGSAGLQHVTKGVFQNTLIPIPPLAEQKRIVAKIEELMPFVEQYAEASSKLNVLNTSFPDMMKKSILQEAVQGKLVPQDPSDEPASELLKKTAEEKKRLIKEGKIKKQKALRDISEEETSFDIPDSWEWVRFGEAVDMLAGFAFKSTDFTREGKYRLLRGINLGIGEVKWDDTVFVDNIPDKLKQFKLESGDVLLGLDRPWISGGIRVDIFDGPDNTYLVQRVLRIREIGCLTSEYCALVLRSNLLSSVVQGQTTGISVPHISPTQVGNIVIPVPPIKEQIRIVNRVSELNAEVEMLKTNSKD